MLGGWRNLSFCELEDYTLMSDSCALESRTPAFAAAVQQQLGLSLQLQSPSDPKSELETEKEA